MARKIKLEKRVSLGSSESATDSSKASVHADGEAVDAPSETGSPTGAEEAHDSGGADGPRRRRVGSAGAAAAGARLALVVAAIAIGLTLVATLLQRPTPPVAQGASVVEPVGSALLLCPEPGAGTDLGVRVTAAIIPGQPGQGDGPGRAGLETLPGRTSDSAKITEAGGQAEINAFSTTLPPIRAFAEGSLAPGLVADQWGRDPGGKGRGMASTACAPAASEFWFVGGGAIAGRTTRIVLVNPDDTAAIADVIVHGPDGVIDAPAGRGLVVKGQDRLVLRMDVLAPGVAATAVQVAVRTGRVGAAVDDEQQQGLTTVGTDWVPPAAEPANRVYLPGIIGGTGARVLSLMAPGTDDAIVNVRVISTDGTFAPADRSRIEVPADSVVTLDMAPVLDQQPSTLELTSNVPIVAGMRMFFGGRNVQDETAYTAGSQPFTGPAAVSGLPVRTNTDVRVAITAPDTAAQVDITLLPYRGGQTASTPTSPRRVKVGAGKVRYIKLNPPAGIRWYTAIITPVDGSGPILVAHRVRESSGNGDLVTGYPWSPLRVQVTVPIAVQDPAVSN